MKREPISDHAERKRILSLIERCEKEQKMEYKTRITKGYYIEVTDKDGYAIAEDWCFGTRKDAEKRANRLKASTVVLEQIDKMCE